MKQYRLHEKSDKEFEDIAVKICTCILGTGTFSFATGPDGGRDGRFEGVAQRFPSELSPLSGRFIIQAKHTSNPTASLSDSSFKRILKKEMPKIEKLVQAGELDFYLLFTNRSVTGQAETRIRQEIRAQCGVKDVFVFGVESIAKLLDLHPEVWRSLELDRFENPLRIRPNDLGDVIVAFYDSREKIESSFDSAHDFAYTALKKKNRVNGLSKEYYEYIQDDSMPSFAAIEAFLKNPRNSVLREKYHSVADEIKAKLIQHKDQFETFDDALGHIYDLVVDGTPDLQHRRRLAHVFLHYMYFSCDIGKHA